MNERISSLKNNIASKLVGKEEQILQLITALLAGGHVLLEDMPGVGKTLLARTLSESAGCSVSRIQFTPDTLPSDVTGASVYDASQNTLRLVKGPVVNQIVIGDELNRTSPRTQAALLEAMEERQVTIDGTTIKIPEPFMVIGTQNPISYAGTYPLPEAQLDRFMMKISLGTLSEDETVRMQERMLEGRFLSPAEPVLSAEEIIEMKKEVRTVNVSKELLHYIAKLILKTGEEEEIRYACSPRASLSLLSASQASAYIKGRDYVIPEDVMDMARLTLPHRMELTAEARMNRAAAEKIAERIIRSVPVPK